ncbi:MAG: AbrB family transcriptional regulator [Solirubrobacteraceae bacterium]
MRTAIRWTVVLVLTIVAALVGDAVGVPSPALLAGLGVGLLIALRTDWALDLPAAGVRGSQAVLGVSFGLLVDADTLRELGSTALPVLVVSVVSLGVTALAGVAMSRVSDVDRPTAAFGMIAGGASGIVAMSRELGADERLVSVMQYLRVLVIVVTVPVVAAAIGGDTGAVSATADGPDGSWTSGILTVVGCVALGAVAARVTRLPAGSMLGPLIVAAAMSLAGVPVVAVPDVLLQAAFVGIGLMVGLRFTVASLRRAARILPATLVGIVGLILASAALGMVLVAWADVGVLDAYLATTPGGLYAVLAVAGTTPGVDAPFVLAVQTLRLFAMLLAAPLLARWVGGRPRAG